MRSITFFTVICVALLWSVAWAGPLIQGEAGLIMEPRTGEVLWHENGYTRMYPASTTKILTALLVLENVRLDEVVTTSSNAFRVEGSSIYLNLGEEQTVEDLLYALMLASANDVSVALAEHVAGTVEKFALMMNQRAQVIGAIDSNFVNPHGLHDPEHYSTAYDQALIAREAMQNPVFREIVATQSKIIPWPEHPWGRELFNQNSLLWRYEGIKGIKNGYTPEASQTFVGMAAKDGVEVISVIMKTMAIWDDTTELLDYGLANFQVQGAILSGEEYQVGQYLFCVDENLDFVTPKGHVANLLYKVDLPEAKSWTELELDASEASLIILVDGEYAGSVGLTLVAQPPIQANSPYWLVWPPVWILALRLRVSYRRWRRKSRFSTINWKNRRII